jgi:type IX secretion system PorP/SprF family membrane protein
VNYRNQWPHITSKFESYSVGGEIYNPAFQGGLGVFAMNTTEGEGFMRTSQFSVIQSFERVIPKVVRIRAGYQVGVINKHIDWSRLVFGDELDPIMGQVYQSKAISPEAGGRTFADFTAGFLLDFPKIKIGESSIGNMIGVNMSHLTEPDESILGLNSRLPRKYVFNYGMYIPLVEEEMTGRYLILYPNVIYEKQRNFETTNIGFYVAKNPMLAGIWYRSRKISDTKRSDAIILNIGLRGDLGKKTSYKMGYSYDFTISGLASNTLGAHEVSLILEFKDAALFTGKGKFGKRKRSNRAQDCEDFGNHTLVF